MRQGNEEKRGGERTRQKNGKRGRRRARRERDEVGCCGKHCFHEDARILYIYIHGK